MIANDDLLNGLRQIATQEASIPALRAALLLFGGFASFAWVRRRPFLALLALSMGGFLGLGYWLVQMAAPLGFETDPALTREWAQAGVNALAEPKGSGFVFGTEPETSLVAALASSGMPLHLVVLAPQMAALLAHALLILLPFGFLKSHTTAAFAACLALGGGIWPGHAPYGSMILLPSAVLIAGALLGMLVAPAQQRMVRRAFNRSRLGIAAGLIAAAVFERALQGGAEPGITAALLLSGTTIILASPLRAALRRVFSASARARRAEGLLLLCVFGGSGLLWWDPPASVAGFNAARDEHAALSRPMNWISRNVPTTSVVLASPAYSAPIAALAGRRVLFSPGAGAEEQASLPEPFRRARLLESTRLGQPLARLAEGFSVTHLFLGPGEASPPAAPEPGTADEPRLRLVLVYQDIKDFRVFRLAKK